MLVTGARQVGKTTMLKHLAESDRTYVAMDNAMARELAKSDPVLFFQTYSTLAEFADIAPSTAKEWLKVLVGLHIVYLPAPYSNNELKRLSKTPKLYFCDTGLRAYLSMWLTPDTFRNGAASGHYYENYVEVKCISTSMPTDFFAFCVTLNKIQ